MIAGLPRNETYIAHGYTLADIHTLSVYAVRTDHWRADLEFSDRVAGAWSAIATTLCGSDTPPHRNELIRVAREASSDVIDQNMRHRGIDKRGATFGESRVNFERFWTRLPGAPLEGLCRGGEGDGASIPHVLSARSFGPAGVSSAVA